ncbi:hypothetical protein O0235_07260 [Tepidiforma flava]|uniref:Uncharacterized protein n=1 Tax=Tepidiforma flava TaxID=3004094 RepID=A0ABY7MA06_9CHLR|nr:hypothetical protein [Tepidiforma flava]WBL37364.1 hypothetical protein O0235_07260 [Tepidiforma flava]
MRRLIAALAAAAALVPFAARADGEAGLVIQVGDQVTTWCVPFTGDSISGEQLLAASGLPVEQFGGGSGRVVCAIGQTGCFDAANFDACFCRCKGGDCTYWAFFTRAYGRGWVYSSVGISLAKAKDGDVHGWKWGRGGPSSAPAPADITFEQICGHPPRGGAAPTAAATAPPSPAPATAAPGAGSSPAAASPTAAATVPPAPSPGSETATAAPSPPTAAGVTITAASPAPPGSTPAAAAGGSAPAAGDDDAAGRLAGFGAVAGALILAIIGAAAWRRRRGR